MIGGVRSPPASVLGPLRASGRNPACQVVYAPDGEEPFVGIELNTCSGLNDLWARQMLPRSRWSRGVDDSRCPWCPWDPQYTSTHSLCAGGYSNFGSCGQAGAQRSVPDGIRTQYHLASFRAYRTRKKGLPSPLPAVGRGGEGQLWLF